MNEARTVLFALSGAGMSPDVIKAFEEKTMVAIRAGSKEYYNSNSVHCDYKDGLIKMCQQYNPNAVIISELLTGNGNVFEIAKEIKSDFPATTIVLLFKDNRPVGDAVLADLVSSGIYDWVVAPWKPELIASSVVSPRKAKDVEAYKPKIIEGANGLAFETKMIQKRVEDEVDTIDNSVFSPENRGLAVEGTLSAINQPEKSAEVDYHQVVNRKHNMGFAKPRTGGLGVNLSLKTSNEPKSEVKEEKTVPTANIESLLQRNIEVKEEEPKPELPKVQKEPVEELKTELKTELIEELKTEEKASDDFDFDRRSMLKNKLSALNKKDEKVEKIKENVPPKFDARPVDKPKAPVKEDRSEAFEKALKTAETRKQEPKPILSLNQLDFNPEYKKVLFVRALPLSSIFPIHLAKLSKAKFVDFNKESCYDGFANVYKTTFKEAKLPDSEYIVADAVAGNGIEKIAKMFDLVIAIMPEDHFAISTFMKRYPNLTNNYIIQNPAKIINFKEAKELFGKSLGKMYFLDEKTPAIGDALRNKKLLMDDPEYAKSVNFIVKNLNRR